jgi:hypothetical protein
LKSKTGLTDSYLYVEQGAFAFKPTVCLQDMFTPVLNHNKHPLFIM